MNCLNTLPYLPTEIWDKIFDIKYSLEDKEEHKIKQNMLLEQFNTLADSLLFYYPVEDWFCRGESINSISYIKRIFINKENGKTIMVKQRACKIDISVFSRAMIRLLEEEYWERISVPSTDDEDEYN